MTATTSFSHDLLSFLIWFHLYDNVLHAERESAYLKKACENSSKSREQQAGNYTTIELYKTKEIDVRLMEKHATSPTASFKFQRSCKATSVKQLLTEIIHLSSIAKYLSRKFKILDKTKPKTKGSSLMLQVNT